MPKNHFSMLEQPQNHEEQNLNEVAAQYGQTLVEPGRKIAFDVQKMEIKGHGVGDIRFGLDILLQFANLPIITDEFKSHKERTAFRNSLSLENPSHYNIFENNKLRGNMISSVEQAFSFINEGLDDTDLLPPVKEEIKTLIATCPKYDNKSYDPMTNEEKVRYVQQLDQMILKIIELLKSSEGKREN
jgi:hypothetical protein